MLAGRNLCGMKTQENIYRDYQGGYFKTLVSPEATGGAFALIEMVLPKGSEPPLHTHELEDETFYMLEGSLEFQIGNEVTVIGPGEAAYAPRKVPHLFRISSASARFLTLISPGNFWNYFIEFSTPTQGEPVAVPLAGPPPPEMIAQLVQRMQESYRITLGA